MRSDDAELLASKMEEGSARRGVWAAPHTGKERRSLSLRASTMKAALPHLDVRTSESRTVRGGML